MKKIITSAVLALACTFCVSVYAQKLPSVCSNNLITPVLAEGYPHIQKGKENTRVILKFKNDGYYETSYDSKELKTNKNFVLLDFDIAGDEYSNILALADNEMSLVLQPNETIELTAYGAAFSRIDNEVCDKTKNSIKIKANHNNLVSIN